MTNSNKPMAINALNFNPSASPNWLAMILAMVLPVSRNPDGILFVLPMSIVTAMVSPNARPNAKIYEATIPELAIGRLIC